MPDDEIPTTDGKTDGGLILEWEEETRAIAPDLSDAEPVDITSADEALDVEAMTRALVEDGLRAAEELLTQLDNHDTDRVYWNQQQATAMAKALIATRDVIAPPPEDIVNGVNMDLTKPNRFELPGEGVITPSDTAATAGMSFDGPLGAIGLVRLQFAQNRVHPLTMATNQVPTAIVHYLGDADNLRAAGRVIRDAFFRTANRLEGKLGS